jgi:hypothetical protein
LKKGKQKKRNKPKAAAITSYNPHAAPPGGGSLAAVEPDPANCARCNGKYNKVCYCLCKLFVVTLARGSSFPIPTRLHRTDGWFVSQRPPPCLIESAIKGFVRPARSQRGKTSAVLLGMKTWCWIADFHLPDNVPVPCVCLAVDATEIFRKILDYRNCKNGPVVGVIDFNQIKLKN